MAFTICGFGTRYFGEADLRPDGSFITTEWITGIGIPILPLRSFRFVRIRSTEVRTWGWDDEVFGQIETLPICWAQVIRIYAFLAGTSIWLTAMFWLLFGEYSLFDREKVPTLVLMTTTTLIAPFLIVSWCRRRAFRRDYGAEPIPRVERTVSQEPLLEIKRSTEILCDW